MTTTISLEIENCSNCPFFECKRIYTEDSFETIFSWHCKKMKGKKIAGYIETFGLRPEVPDWCPIKITKKKATKKKATKKKGG